MVSFLKNSRVCKWGGDSIFIYILKKNKNFLQKGWLYLLKLEMGYGMVCTILNPGLRR